MIDKIHEPTERTGRRREDRKRVKERRKMGRRKKDKCG